MRKRPDAVKRLSLSPEGDPAQHRHVETPPRPMVGQPVRPEGAVEILRLAELLGRRAARRRYRSMGCATVLDRRALLGVGLIVGALLMLLLLGKL